MAASLAEKTCIPCRGGTPPLEASAAKELLSQAPSWTLVDGAHRIERTFRFANFKGALEFVNKIGELAEVEPIGPLALRGFLQPVPAFKLRKLKG